MCNMEAETCSIKLFDFQEKFIPCSSRYIKIKASQRLECIQVYWSVRKKSYPGKEEHLKTEIDQYKVKFDSAELKELILGNEIT